jgi:3-oxoacyl-[acyl-carrier protein] reductase
MKGAAIVTGGAGGIGRAVMARLARDGYAPACWDRYGDATGDSLSIPVDVTDERELAGAARHTERSLGPIRALIVNAGILGPVERVWEADPNDVRRVMDTNLVSAFLTLWAVVPLMLRNAGPDRGRIVVIASVQGKEGTALAGPYAASKAGLIAMTKSLGKELATEGILANVVTPTVVNGAMERSLTPDRRADLMARIPMGRPVEPEEVAAMVSFLCGPDCTASTGAVFDLSGGRSTY